MKYRNKVTILDGIRFDSRKEASRWAELRMLERAGVIRDLRRQVKYILIPAQHIQPGKGRRKLIEKECAYIADFVYTENGKIVVEDTKGVKTAAYIIKRKLMLERYGIRILEV